MQDYSSLYERLRGLGLFSWVEKLPSLIDAAFLNYSNPHINGRLRLLNALPEISAETASIRSGCITIGRKEDCSNSVRKDIERILRLLSPWRKGPFDIFGIFIDCEWRSYMKWNRLKDKIMPLSGRLVLDVGCGNGYFLFRMAGDGSELCVGLDPYILYNIQFQAVRRFYKQGAIFHLPLRWETLPEGLKAFDTVFSMGLFYHCRSPIDYLIKLKGCMKKGGELILETIIIEGRTGDLLVPESRYAKMNNVWFIPSCPMIKRLLKRCGFSNIRCIDVSKTTVEEQRQTEWMMFESLSDYLDKKDPSVTVEGLPAPKRAIFTAIV